MIKNLVQIVISIFLLVGTTSVSAQEEESPVRILFVGNSFTYFYNLSQVVEAMAESQGVKLYTRQSTVGGSRVDQHWNEEKGTRTRKMLDSLDWDYVVLNNHSLATINNPDEFLEYNKKFVDLIRSKGAEPVFMQTQRNG